MRQRAASAGRRFGVGASAFAWLAEKSAEMNHDGNSIDKRSFGTIGN
jgi:hypothetical protein